MAMMNGAQVQPMMVMVPALLGLKGNLEMTLASRLSTVSWKIKKKMTLDNFNIKLQKLTNLA